MAGDWLEEVLAATDVLFEDTLGPDISDDARTLCPVFAGENSTAGYSSLEIAERLGNVTPGALLESIEFHLNGHDLIVSATGSDERSYAYYVETGHRIVVFGYDTGEYKEPQPFLRPALYQIREGVL
jgi:hypothetical protein